MRRGARFPLHFVIAAGLVSAGCVASRPKTLPTSSINAAEASQPPSVSSAAGGPSGLDSTGPAAARHDAVSGGDPIPVSVLPTTTGDVRLASLEGDGNPSEVLRF